MATEIKKVKAGWVYDGVLFVDERDAIEALNADKLGNAYEVDSNAKIRFEYSTEMEASFGRFVLQFIKQNSGIATTVMQFAAGIDVSRPTLYEWMKGNSMPSRKHIDRIVEFTGVNRLELATALSTNLKKSAAQNFGVNENDIEEVIKGTGKVSGGYAARGHGSKPG
jgi:hypothetical protein